MLGSARQASSLPACGRGQQGLGPLAWALEECTRQVLRALVLPGRAISTLGNFVGAEAKELGWLIPGSPDKAAAVSHRHSECLEILGSQLRKGCRNLAVLRRRPPGVQET